MSSYEQLALIYEEFMRDAPYEKWMSWLLKDFPQLSSLQIADIGCGTGTLTRMLASRAPSVIGVEPSESMLGIAAERALAERRRVQWLCQDARKLKLPRQVDLVVSTCDTLNYLITEQDFKTALKKMWENLNAGGILAFDVIGTRRLQQLADGFSYDIREDAAVLFETRVDSESHISYELYAFVETDEGLYQRFEEFHEQRFYAIAEIHMWLEDIGFQVLDVEGDFGEATVENATRVVFTAKKPDVSHV